MANCPNCGAFVKDKEKFCGSCGSPVTAGPTRPAARPARGLRGLNIAIAVLAVLCVATAGLWIAWPHLRSDSVAVNPVNPYTSVQSTPVTRVTATPAPSPAAVTLRVGSWWHGALRVSNYQGSGELNAESLEVWAYLGKTDEGRCYFEIFDKDHVDDSTLVILSFYIDLHSDYFVPVIGENDAWFFNIYLDQSDVDPLTIRLRNGSLDFVYAYRSADESCDISVHLEPK